METEAKVMFKFQCDRRVYSYKSEAYSKTT